MRKPLPACAKLLGSLEPGASLKNCRQRLLPRLAQSKKQPLVAVLHVDRLQQEKIGREMHEPTPIPRRLVDVDDARLRLGGGVHRKVRSAGDPLVGAGRAEALAVCKVVRSTTDQLEVIGHDCALPRSSDGRRPAPRSATRPAGSPEGEATNDVMRRRTIGQTTRAGKVYSMTRKVPGKSERTSVIPCVLWRHGRPSVRASARAAL